MPAIIFLLFLVLFMGGSLPGGGGPPLKASAGGHEPWTLTVTGLNCTTAVSAPIDCSDVLAANKFITYTITNLRGFSQTRTRTFPATMNNEALENSLAHELHQRKYAPPAKKSVAPGFTLTK